LAACSDASVKSPVTPVIPAHHSEGPALWLVQDEDTKVYLFGTIHVLRPELEWQTKAFKSALDSADAIYLEADVSHEAQAAIQADVMDMGLYKGGRTLKGALNDEEEDKLEEVVTKIGLPMAAVDTMEPWFATMTMSVVQLMQTGYSPESGVETQVEKMAAANDKPLRFFETAKEQLSIFDNLPEDVQVNFLNESLASMDTMKEDMDEMVKDWSEGDIAAVAEFMNESLSDPIIEKALLTDRNANWVVAIDQLLDDEAGTFFVAVGAGHLIGKGSVITMLEDKGMTIERQ